MFILWIQPHIYHELVDIYNFPLCIHSIFMIHQTFYDASLKSLMGCGVKGLSLDALVPKVVPEESQFFRDFFRILIVEISDSIYNIQPYKCTYSLIKQVPVKPW